MAIGGYCDFHRLFITEKISKKIGEKQNDND
jgi:hypothetical protein